MEISLQIVLEYEYENLRVVGTQNALQSSFLLRVQSKQSEKNSTAWVAAHQEHYHSAYSLSVRSLLAKLGSAWSVSFKRHVHYSSAGLFSCRKLILHSPQLELWLTKKWPHFIFTISWLSAYTCWRWLLSQEMGRKRTLMKITCGPKFVLNQESNFPVSVFCGTPFLSFRK